jgi:hypothetical protein
MFDTIFTRFKDAAEKLSSLLPKTRGFFQGSIS